MPFLKGDIQPNWIIFALFCVFGVSSWITINSVFVELTTLANTLPEGWKIASQLGIVIQIANIFAFLYFILVQRCKFKSETLIIYLLLILGIFTTLLMGVMWDKTLDVAGSQISFWILFLTFIGGIVDCTTSVVYWPFVAQYKSPLYASALATGEGMSGAVSGIIGLAQNQRGSGDNLKSNFSTSVFFFLMAFFMFLSLLAFTYIRFSRLGRTEHTTGGSDFASLLGKSEDNVESPNPDETSNSKESPDGISSSHSINDDLGTSYEQPSSYEIQKRILHIVKWPLAAQLVLNFWQNGILPGITTYAFLNYQDGSAIMALASNIGLVADPVVCFLGSFFQWFRLEILTCLCVGLAVFEFVVALMSPNPMLVGSASGGWIMFLIAILLKILLAYTKTMVYLKMRFLLSTSPTKHSDSEIAFRWSGLVTQIGSCIGSFLIFILVNYSSLFHSAY